jgi:hypothetical protein
MATNHYFQSGIPMGRRSESLLHEDLIIECLKMYGHDVYYMPRAIVNRDFILGEDPTNNFKHAYPIEVYLENVTGYGGTELLSRFGIELTDTATFLMARRRWDELINRSLTSILTSRPSEGDLLYVPLTKSFFEIKLVEATDPFFQVGKLYVYKLQCELYQFSHETISTGVQELDEITDDINQDILTYEITLETGDGLLLEYDTQSSLIQENYDTSVIDHGAENEKFTDEVNDILDFSEHNPFGDIVR